MRAIGLALLFNSGTVRYLGTFLEDPLAVPQTVLRTLAKQLHIEELDKASAYSAGEQRWEMREAAQADVAIVSAGGIRDSLPEGEIRWRDILTALPFRNEIVTIRIDGKALQAYLHRVDGITPGTGAYTQTNGTNGKGAGRMIGGKRLDPAGVYTLATTRCDADGGDGYPMMQASGTGILVAEAVRDHFIRHQVVDSSAYVPGVASGTEVPEA